MKYNLDFDHITGLLEQMGEDAVKAVQPNNVEKPIDENSQLGLQLAQLFWKDTKFANLCRTLVMNSLVTPQEGIAAIIELGYRMALSDVQRNREVEELNRMFQPPQGGANG